MFTLFERAHSSGENTSWFIYLNPAFSFRSLGIAAFSLQKLALLKRFSELQARTPSSAMFIATRAIEWDWQWQVQSINGRINRDGP